MHIGIIAEYNPFHNGHEYQIHTIKKIFPEKEVAIVMSGNFVQRGEPAIFHKYLRTKMALSCGADFILELPAIFSSASAEYFANAAVLSLAATNCIDTLCFGAECDDIVFLQSIADILEEEPDIFRKELKNLLSQGLSFPKARSMALTTYMKNPIVNEIISQPNNILAIEYLKAIKHHKLSIEPYIIKRTVNNYHDFSISKQNEGFVSANAIRKQIELCDFENENVIFDKIKPYIPENAYKILDKDPYNKPIFLSDLYPMIQNSLKCCVDIESCQNVFKDLANQLNRYDIFPYDIELFIDELSHKNITKSRISRSLLSILLAHKKERISCLKEQGYISYLKILGFRKNAVLAKQIKTNCTLPILTKTANYKKILVEESIGDFENQINADNYYRQAYYNKYHEKIPSEFEHSVIIQE